MWNIITHLCEMSRTIWTTILSLSKQSLVIIIFSYCVGRWESLLESRRAEAEKPTSVGPDCVCVLWRGQLCLRCPGSACHKLANGVEQDEETHTAFNLEIQETTWVPFNSLIALLWVRLSRDLPNSIPIKVKGILTAESVGKEENPRLSVLWNSHH